MNLLILLLLLLFVEVNFFQAILTFFPQKINNQVFRVYTLSVLFPSIFICFYWQSTIYLYALYPPDVAVAFTVMCQFQWLHHQIQLKLLGIIVIILYIANNFMHVEQNANMLIRCLGIFPLKLMEVHSSYSELYLYKIGEYGVYYFLNNIHFSSTFWYAFVDSKCYHTSKPTMLLYTKLFQ